MKRLQDSCIGSLIVSIHFSLLYVRAEQPKMKHVLESVDVEISNNINEQSLSKLKTSRKDDDLTGFQL